MQLKTTKSLQRVSASRNASYSYSLWERSPGLDEDIVIRGCPKNYKAPDLIRGKRAVDSGLSLGKGFTLIELLVVIAIIAILSVVSWIA